MAKKIARSDVRHCMECKNRFVASSIGEDKYEMWCDGYGLLSGEKDHKFPNIPDWCPLEDAETEAQDVD